MKTPWSSLMQYGTAIAAMAVIVAASLIFLTVLGVAILISKMLVLIK
jgi:hypothetical protein